MDGGLLLAVKLVPVVFGALLPVLNPVGTAIVLLSMTEGASGAERRRIARAVSGNAFLLMAAVFLAGTYVLAFFGIGVPVVRLAGGLVLAVMGWKLLGESEGGKGAATPSGAGFADRTFYPFTFPLTVGPGVVAVTLTLSAHSTQSRGTVATAWAAAGALLGIAAVAVVTYFCLAYAGHLTRRLGPSGTSALVRLMAFVVLCLGVQIAWTGLAALVHGL